MKKIIENWNTYQDGVLLLESRILNESYITNTLGIKIPLNESYPYSKELNEEILREHLLFEGFWGNLGQKIKQGAVDKWEAAKSLPSDLKNIFVGLYKAFVGGQADLYLYSLTRKVLRPVRKKIYGFLNKIIEFAPKLKMPNFGKAAKKIKDLIISLLSKDYGKPWMKALALTGIAAGLQYILKSLGDQVDELISSANPLEILKDIVKEKALQLMQGTLDKITSQIRAAFGDVTQYFEWISSIVGGASVARDFFKNAIDDFLSRLETSANLFASK